MLVFTHDNSIMYSWQLLMDPLPRDISDVIQEEKSTLDYKAPGWCACALQERRWSGWMRVDRVKKSYLHIYQGIHWFNSVSVFIYSSLCFIFHFYLCYLSLAQAHDLYWSDVWTVLMQNKEKYCITHFQEPYSHRYAFGKLCHSNFCDTSKGKNTPSYI